MKGISLCMICKNEEKNIARCLERAMPLVKEMVVCDTGSTDKTVEIAKSMGARVVHFKWIDDFAAARNFAASCVNTDYMMILDADEWVSAKDYDNARKQFADVMAKGTALCVVNQTYVPEVCLGMHPNPGTHPDDEMGLGFSPAMRVLLCPSIVKHVYRIHENPDLRECGHVYADPPFATHHSGHMDVSQQKSKTWYYDLGVQKLKEHGDSFEIRCELGTQAFANGMYKESFEHWARAVSYNPKEPLSRMGVAAALFALGRYKQGLKQVRNADKILPNCPEILHNLAWSWLINGNAKKCEELCMKALEIRPSYTSALILGLVSLISQDGSPDGVRVIREKLRSKNVENTLCSFAGVLGAAKQKKYCQNILDAVAGSVDKKQLASETDLYAECAHKEPQTETEPKAAEVC